MKAPFLFVKYSGNGNDFIILNRPSENPTSEIITQMCDRYFGIGADGVLILSESAVADGRMRIFNADGGEAEMCANGLRCLATYLDDLSSEKKSSYTIQTMNSVYTVYNLNHAMAIEMAEIKDRNLYDFTGKHPFEKSFYINTGVPHLVFLVTNAHSINIKEIAPPYRHHHMFPNGSNVSFVEVKDEGSQFAYVRTFERGVEDETHSCGTGLTASALALEHWFGWRKEIKLQTKGGKQKVSVGDKVFYSGEVRFCFSGEYPLER